MKSRIADKIITNVMRENDLHYTKKQVQRALFQWISVFDKRTQINAIGCVCSASCGDMLPFTDYEVYGWDEPFFSYDLAKAIGKYF